MVNSRQLSGLFLLLASFLGSFPTLATPNDDEIIAGPAYSDFRLTLNPGWRAEAFGPFFYDQLSSGQTEWGIPPFFTRTMTPDVDWDEWDFLYPIMNYRRFGKEYRWQIAQVFNFTGGQTPQEEMFHHQTLFPLYFHQKSPTNNYTAFFPIYGHLENRMFRDDIKFIMFPLYSETRRKDVVTDNYLYPIFDRRRGPGMSGWQVWPFYGEDHKTPSLVTNSMGDVGTNGGYHNSFVLWPFYIKSHASEGTTNPSTSLTLVPFYSRIRSPSRDVTSYGFPFGYNTVQDREQKFVEHNFIWPLYVFAHGSKEVKRYFPIYSHARRNGVESDSYGFLVYKYNRLVSPPLDRHRARVLYFLYSDTVERNTESHDVSRHVELWPFYTYRRELDGNRRLQVMAILEPFFPNNRAMAREYSQVYSFWRQEKNARTGAYSQSLLWNLYRRERVGTSKKASLFFGLFKYESNAAGSHWRLAGLNLGGKKAGATATKS